MKQNEDSQICVCGHPKKKHRRNGKCTKCGCKMYGEEAHPPECRCEPCAWNRILELEKRARELHADAERMNKYIDNELRVSVNKHEYFLGEVFKLSPQDLLDLEAFREKEEKRKADQEEQNEKDKKKIEQAMEQQAVKMGYKEPRAAIEEGVPDDNAKPSKEELAVKKSVQPKPKPPTTPP